MSVEVSKRGRSKFEILVKADSLAVYTLRICSNENNFPARYDKAITNDIMSTVKEIVICVTLANDIRVDDTENGYQMRRDYQERAIYKCNMLLVLIRLAIPIFHISSRRIAYWGRMIINVRESIKSWKQSDRRRYATPTT